MGRHLHQEGVAIAAAIDFLHGIWRGWESVFLGEARHICGALRVDLDAESGSERVAFADLSNVDPLARLHMQADRVGAHNAGRWIG